MPFNKMELKKKDLYVYWVHLKYAYKLLPVITVTMRGLLLLLLLLVVVVVVVV